MFVDGPTRIWHTALAGVLAAGLLFAACGGPYEPVPQAPAFLLEDRNPASLTYGDLRSPEDVRGKVLLIYFVSFG